MKKFLLILLVFGCLCAGLSAQTGMSAGGGANFTAQFTNFVSKDYSDSGSLVGGGFYGFFDATFVEANLGLLFGGVSMGDSGGDAIVITALKLGLFGKYPVDMGGFSLFPMLGIEGQINLGASHDGNAAEGEALKKINEYLSYFWFKGGVGLDVPISSQVYFRPEFLYGIRLNTEDERDMLDFMGDGSVIIGHGLDIRLAIGFNF